MKFSRRTTDVLPLAYISKRLEFYQLAILMRQFLSAPLKMLMMNFLWKNTDLTEDKHLRNRFDKREHHVLSI